MNPLLKQYVTPFEESETPTKAIDEFDLESEIERHDKAEKILQAILSFRNKKKAIISHIEGFGGTFPRLRAKYVNDVDTINRCINRLHSRYKKVMN